MPKHNTEKKVVIVGAYGGANIGDEAILYAVVRLVRLYSNYKDVTVVTLLDGGEFNKYQAKEYPKLGVQWIAVSRFTSLLRLLWRSDVIIGGGQIIDGMYGATLPLIQFFVALCCRLSGGRVMIGGVGATDNYTLLTKIIYKSIFILSNVIILRDAASLNRVQNLIGREHKLRYAPDFVFSLKADFPKAEVRRYAVLAVHHAPHLSLLNHEVATKIALHMSERFGRNFVIVAHDLRPDFDLSFAKSVASNVAKLSNAQAPAVKIFSSTYECLEFYASATVVVSSRMHPLILAAISGCRCVPLAGSDKVSELCKTLELNAVLQEKLSSDFANYFRPQLPKTSILDVLCLEVENAAKEMMDTTQK